MSASELGDGITVPAYYYMNYAGQDSIAGLATSALTRNVVYLGQDWRHFANLDTVLRGILDYNARNGSDIVPVELLDFDAIDRNKRVEISWSTLSEYNTDHFEIERKASGTDMFSTIFRTDAAGRSNTVKTYGPIVDSDVNYGNSYIYRLRTVDLDGASTLSNEVEVSLDNFFGVTPNPASSVATYSFNVGDNRNVNINLYDISGKLVKSLFNGGVSGNYTLDIDVTSLANGTYTIVLTDGEQTYTSNLHVRR